MSDETRNILRQLMRGENLSENVAASLLRMLASGEPEPALAGAVLVALSNKGESADEIRGFAMAMRALARRPDIPDVSACVDIVGTGGDGSGSLNLSTGSALLAASCGLSVVKHGNRSITSRSGSADVLKALGLPVPLNEAAAGECFAALGFTFLFAPHYHPAMKHIAPIRLALGVRTVFNLLGPLVNPAEPAFHVIGAPSETIAQLMAHTLAEMPIERAVVIRGAADWDEPTPIGPFACYKVDAGSVERTIRDPLDFGVPRCSEADLKGDDAQSNAHRLREALSGRDTAAHRDALSIGAALALEVTGRAPSFELGLRQARAALDDGVGAAFLSRFDAHVAALG